MQKKAFKEYLLHLGLAEGTANDKVSYCGNWVERIVGELDSVVCDFNKIIQAERLLATQKSPIKKAFHDYIGFYYSPKIKNGLPPGATMCSHCPLGKVTPTSSPATDSMDDGGCFSPPCTKGQETQVLPQIPIVQYYSNVPSADKDENLRKSLESEYYLILNYAQNIMGSLIENAVGFIPVYLSCEIPAPTIYKANKTYINRFVFKCQIII